MSKNNTIGVLSAPKSNAPEGIPQPTGIKIITTAILTAALNILGGCADFESRKERIENRKASNSNTQPRSCGNGGVTTRVPGTIGERVAGNVFELGEPEIIRGYRFAGESQVEVCINEEGQTGEFISIDEYNPYGITLFLENGPNDDQLLNNIKGETCKKGTRQVLDHNCRFKGEDNEIGSLNCRPRTVGETVCVNPYQDTEEAIYWGEFTLVGGVPYQVN